MKLEKDQILSILESFLFAYSEPVSLTELQALFDGTLPKNKIKFFMEELGATYKQSSRGIEIVEVKNGFQLRTKLKNKDYLAKTLKARPFRLSAPALETLAVIAYSQPCTKLHVEEVRGTECSHLMRTLMEKGLVQFAGKSSLPGKPSLYKTSQKFLEVFGFKNLKDLPSKEEISTLLPKTPTIGRETLSDVITKIPTNPLQIPYEEDEKENQKIKDSLKSIPTNVRFLDTDN